MNGNPRSVVIIRHDLFDATASVTVCALTTDPTDAPLFRTPSDDTTGIYQPSPLMVEEITTIPRSKLGEHVGRLSEDFAGDDAFEAADALGFGLAFCEAAGDVGSGGVVVAHADDHDPIERPVGVAAGSSIEPEPDGVAR